MRNETRQLLRELIDDKVFDTQERVAELRRQARERPLEQSQLHGEANRLEERVKEMHKAREEICAT